MFFVPLLFFDLMDISDKSNVGMKRHKLWLCFFLFLSGVLAAGGIVSERRTPGPGGLQPHPALTKPPDT